MILLLTWMQAMKAKNPTTVVTGLSHGQTEYFQKKLGVASKDASYIHAGRRLEKMGDFDGAIESYKRALSGYKGVAQICIANAYEKKHDYKNALEWMVIARDDCPEWSRKPDIERVAYLEHVIQGEYDQAIEHAQKAIDEYDAIMHGNGLQKQEYIDRLNDLIAAKDYIESLKKN